MFSTIKNGLLTAALSLFLHPVFSSALPQTTISDIHAFDDQTIIVGTHEGVFKTEDGGENWLPMNAGLSNTVIQNLYVLNQNILFARVFGAGNTLFKSHDGGKSWNVLNQNFMDVSYFYTLDSNTLFAGATDDGLFASTDGGRKWTRISKGLDIGTVDSLYAINASTLFAGTRGRLYKTTNGGKSWAWTTVGNSLPVSSIVAPSAQTLFAKTRTGGVFTSTDGGKQWRPMNDGLSCHTTLTSLHALDTGTLLAGTFCGVFKTRNGGVLWEATETSLSDTVISSFYALNEGTVFAGSRFGELFKSNDAGEHWELLGQVSMASQRKPSAAIS